MTETNCYSFFLSSLLTMAAPILLNQRMARSRRSIPTRGMSRLILIILVNGVDLSFSFMSMSVHDVFVESRNVKYRFIENVFIVVTDKT